jgi:hypothetical protein
VVLALDRLATIRDGEPVGLDHVDLPPGNGP